jgi:hypothetical protein
LDFTEVFPISSAPEKRSPPPPPALLRDWKNRDGKTMFKAEFVDFVNGKAILRKAGGEVVEVSPGSISKADEEWVRETQKQRNRRPDRARRRD